MVGWGVFAFVWLALMAATWSRADDSPVGGVPSNSDDDRSLIAEQKAGEMSDRAPASSLGRAPASGDDDEYSFKWLDPDKKIYVLQNRKFRKENRANVSILFGPGISNSYRSTAALGFRGGYNFAEDWAIEFFYDVGLAKENSTWEALKTTSSNAKPVVREIRGAYGALLQWSPWYAKINVFNTILHFDWYFNGGLGSVRTALDTRNKISDAASYVDETKFGIFLGTGQFFHVTQNFGFRVDLTGMIYQAPNLGASGDNTFYSEYFFGFGLGWKL